MSLQSSPFFQLTSHVLDHKIVGIDVDGLVPDDELLVRFPICVNVPDDLHIYIINIKLMTPHCQEIVLIGIVIFESNQKEP